MANQAADKWRRSRHDWYGIKPLAKRVLALSAPHRAVCGVAWLLGSRLPRERLPAPASLDRVTARMAGVSFVMLRPDRCIVAKELYWGNGRRPRPADQLALDVFAMLAGQARLVIDVGAYTGLFSLLAARCSSTAQVHGYEVVRAVAQAARENVVANDLEHRVTIHRVAIGADGDSVVVDDGAGGSALPDFYSTRLSFSGGTKIEVRSLDAVVRELRVGPPAVVKIDVEGTEDVVLRHAQSFLASHRPDILCEVLPGGNAPAVQAALEPHSYRYLRVEERILRPHAMLEPREHYRDWLFTTRSDTELASLGGSSRGRWPGLPPRRPHPGRPPEVA